MSIHNISLTPYDIEAQNLEYVCPLDCIDWHNGCTECLCNNNTLSSLCNLNLNTQTYSTSYIEPHCQTSKNDLHRHGYNISILIWFSIININTQHELFLPLSLSFDLTTILSQYISQYTPYQTYIQNISCSILYPYNYSNYYAFNSNTNDTYTLNMDEIFHNIVPLHDHTNHTYPTFNNTNIINSSTLFSTQFTTVNSSNSPSMIPTLAPIVIDSITEYDGNYYNYMPQCTLSFVNQHTAMQFMMDFRNESNILRDNLHTIMSYYIHNISILLASDDINETLYEYTQENQHLYIQYINDSNVQLAIYDINDTTIQNTYQLLLNKSLYSIQFNSFSSYFGNISAAMPVTLSPTTAPTSPRDCWFSSKLIAHNTTYYQNACYFVFCDNGKTDINDKYCDAQCYANHSSNTTSVCCVTPDGTHCGEANDDCPKQNDCASCVQDNERICAWIGDHCSAVCVGEYCWTDGKCPKRIIIRLHIRGISMQQLNVNQALLNHAIAESLDITENLVGDYFPTQTPNLELIEVKKAISLTVSDEQRIPKILSADPNDEYVEILNSEIIKAFESVPGIRWKIKIESVEYGGFEGENNDKKSHTERSDAWLTLNAFIILLVCGVLVMITICALCYRYPMLSYCCCCIPIRMRRKVKNCTRNHCCECCQRFSFGVLYDDDMSDLIKRRREERRRNLQIRNEIMEEEQHLNVDIRENENENENGDIDGKEEEDYHELTREIKKSKSVKKKKNKNKNKKSKKKKKKRQKKSLSEYEENETIHNDIVQQNEMNLHNDGIDAKEQEIAMTNLRTIKNKNTMLYYDRNRDLIEEDETNTIL